MSEPKPVPYDPTAGLRLPAPLTNEELDALRPKAVVGCANREPARRFAYRTATNLEVVERLETLESTVAWLKEELVRQAAKR
jgi:hypothetical protein